MLYQRAWLWLIAYFHPLEELSVYKCYDTFGLIPNNLWNFHYDVFVQCCSFFLPSSIGSPFHFKKPTLDPRLNSFVHCLIMTANNPCNFYDDFVVQCFLSPCFNHWIPVWMLFPTIGSLPLKGVVYKWEFSRGGQGVGRIELHSENGGFSWMKWVTRLLILGHESTGVLF